MPNYGSDSNNPSYVESVASLKRKTKETLRIDNLIPSEILNDADRGDGKANIKTLLEKYYEFMNMDEFIYDQSETFTDVIASGRAVFRIKDPTQDNNEFFADHDGANSTLIITNNDNSTTTITLLGTNVQISNGNELPGSLKTLTTEVGQTFTVSGLLSTGIVSGAVSNSTAVTLAASNVNITVGQAITSTSISGGCTVTAITGASLTLSSAQTIPDGATLTFSHNGKSCVLTTPIKHWVGPGPSYILNAIEEALNIDTNTEDYLELMQKEIAQAIPRNLTVDKRSLYKNIVDFYKLKGSSDSIEIFFRLLFNENVETDFPYDKTLIPSSGKWDTDLNQYLDHKGFLSDNIKIQDSLFYQKFAYVIRTGKNLSDWGPAFEKLVHPAGFIFFGEILILTQLTRAALGDNIRQSAVELDTGYSEGAVGSIPVPGQAGYVYKYKDLYGRVNRKTLSSMPGLQPGVIGAEDVALLVEMFASTFLPNLTPKINESGQLSINLTSGVISNVSIVHSGYGYSVNLGSETIVNGQKLYDGPDITITGDAIDGTSIGVGQLTCKVDVDGRIDTVTIVSGGSNYRSASASPDNNTNAGKIKDVKINGNLVKKYNTTAFGINKGSDGKIIEATTDISPTLVFSAPTSTDTDGVLLTSNVTATGNAVLNADGEITSINITNVGNGYVRDPKVSISSASSTERKAREVKEIVILALNHVAAEVNDPAFRSLINNNYFNLKKESYYTKKKFRDNYPISFFSDNIIQNSYSSTINNYNAKTIIHQE